MKHRPLDRGHALACTARSPSPHRAEGRVRFSLAPRMSNEQATHVNWTFDEKRHRIHTHCGGEVALCDGRPKCQRCGAVDDNGGWRKRMLMWNWHWLSLDGWPEWDIVGEGVGRHPPFVELTVVKGSDKASLDIAREWDDAATGLFYNRDWTSDGLPFVGEGESYRAGFWFEKTADRDAFVQRYGGIAR